MEITFTKIWYIFVVQFYLVDVNSHELMCPEGWLTFRSQCYQFVNTNMTWTDAKDFCEKDGGFLASVTSPDEYKFILEQAINRKGSDYWLGGTDSAVERTWKWESGETWDYTAWAKNEPNNGHGRGQNCLALWSSAAFLWDDEFCNSVNTFICEVSLKNVSTNRTTVVGMTTAMTTAMTTTAMTTAMTTGATRSDITDIIATDAMSINVSDRACTSKLIVILIVTAAIFLQIVTIALCLICIRRRRSTDMVRSGMNASEYQPNDAMLYLTAPSDQDTCMRFRLASHITKKLPKVTQGRVICFEQALCT